MRARDFDFWDDMEIDLDNLGCLMLNVDNPLKGFPEFLTPQIEANPLQNTVELKSHVTLRYGFLPIVKRKHVEAVIQHMVLPTRLSVDHHLTSFDFRSGMEVIVAEVSSKGVLEYINAKLGILPNVQTFVPYLPHITIGYFEEFTLQKYRSKFNELLKYSVNVGDLDYGENLQ